jgi:phosphatidylethanolamine-binding protein (PEBP) family uncharacterized protein
MSFRFVSSAVDPTGYLPCWYAKAGNDCSPPVGWAGLPPETGSIAVTCENLSATPEVLHWVLYDLAPYPATVFGGLPKRPVLDFGSHQATNSFGVTGWTGPGEDGGIVTLTFTGYALPGPLGLPGGAPAAEVAELARENALAICSFTGTYFPRRRRPACASGAGG